MMEASNVQPIATEEDVLPIGTVLSGDQFTVTEQLGAGGFGVTYKATDNVLSRTIVIKECFPEDFCFRDGLNVAARAKAHEEPFRSIVRMFMREAQSLAKLRHPNIVGVHRAFEENDTAYMALDLIDGRDLLDVIFDRNIQFSPARVKDILVQLLDAIEKVHSLDLLHRDISPDNIIIEKNGVPVLIDFGAARSDASRRTRAVTSMMMVKDGYSPQEFYVAGSVQTPSSDLYALGATFYHLVSGEAPVNSQTRMMELASNKPDPCVPLVGRIPGYAPEFLQAIDTAMQLHPSERLQSAAQWRSLIATAEVDDQEMQRVRTAPPVQEVELDLQVSLSKLVEQTNEKVRKTRLIQAEPEPEPEPEAEPEVPEWLEEFNRESLAQPEPSETDLAAAPEAEDLQPEVSRPVVPRVVSRPNDQRTRLQYAPSEAVADGSLALQPEPDLAIAQRVGAEHAVTPPRPASRPIPARNKRPISRPTGQPLPAQNASAGDMARLRQDSDNLRNALKTQRMTNRLTTGPVFKDPSMVGANVSLDKSPWPQMVGPLAKYLTTGICIGLLAFLTIGAFYPTVFQSY